MLSWKRELSDLANKPWKGVNFFFVYDGCTSQPVLRKLNTLQRWFAWLGHSREPSLWDMSHPSLGRGGENSILVKVYYIFMLYFSEKGMQDIKDSCMKCPRRGELCHDNPFWKVLYYVLFLFSMAMSHNLGFKKFNIWIPNSWLSQTVGKGESLIINQP